MLWASCCAVRERSEIAVEVAADVVHEKGAAQRSQPNADVSPLPHLLGRSRGKMFVRPQNKETNSSRASTVHPESDCGEDSRAPTSASAAHEPAPEPPARAGPDDDGSASTASFRSARSRCILQLEEPAPESAGLTGDAALVVEKAAARLRGGRASDWQADWCTQTLVQMHLDSKGGDVEKASETLAEALRVRDQFRDVLSFVRQPVWQGDIRVLARDESGHTCVYFCMKNQVDHPDNRATIEGIALVLEVAVRQLRGEAKTFDVVCDCHGLRLSRNLDPRPSIGFAALLKHVFRDRLRLGVVVDPGAVFHTMWRAFAPALPARTREKIVLAPAPEALRRLGEVAGRPVRDAVAGQMEANRAPGPSTQPIRQPTELEEDYMS